MDSLLKYPCMMGVFNLTPDSFSDGGQLLHLPQVLARAEEAIKAGVQILDIGGESTRPGAKTISQQEEIGRILPTIQALHAAYPDVLISVDTRKASVAQVALKAGAYLVNDVSGLRFSGVEMLDVILQHEAQLILMHSQGEPETMQRSPSYKDVIEEVGDFFEKQLALAEVHGLGRHRIILDPGFGFGKNLSHNLRLLSHLSVLIDRFQLPMLVGTSRKSFLTLGHAEAIPPENREALTAASIAIAYQQGARIFRVHDWHTHGWVLDLLANMKANG